MPRKRLLPEYAFDITNEHTNKPLSDDRSARVDASVIEMFFRRDGNVVRDEELTDEQFQQYLDAAYTPVPRVLEGGTPDGGLTDKQGRLLESRLANVDRLARYWRRSSARWGAEYPDAFQSALVGALGGGSSATEREAINYRQFYCPLKVSDKTLRLLTRYRRFQKKYVAGSGGAAEPTVEEIRRGDRDPSRHLTQAGCGHCRARQDDARVDVPTACRLRSRRQ